MAVLNGESDITGNGVPVVIYVFEGDIKSPLSPILTRIMTKEPRDIALAIKIKEDSNIQNSESNEAQGSTGAEASIEEEFEELGMEFIDETAEAMDDDERRK